MRTVKTSLLLLPLLCLAQPVHALYWQLTPPPGKTPDNQPHAAHNHAPAQAGAAQRPSRGRMGHGGSQPTLSETDGVEVSLWMPTSEEVALEGNRPQLPRMAAGYYQALVAIRKHPQGEDSAVHYLRLRSQEKPDLRGKLALRDENRISPADLTRVQKARLEIVPHPLPREHRVYHEGMRADFEVRLDGKPLPGASVGLRSSNGSIQIEQSDSRGRVRFILPMDFKEVMPGRNATPPAEMVLRTVYRDQGTRHASSLTMPYTPHPSNWQSANWAFGLLLAGMVGGGLLGRRVIAHAPTPGKSRKKILSPEDKA